MLRATNLERRGKGRAGRNSARALCRRNQEGRYGLIPGPNNGLGRSPYLNKIFGAGLGSPFLGRARREDICTMYSIYINGVFPGNGKWET